MVLLTAVPAASGPATTAPPAVVVGLGDSVMAGTHCDCAGMVAEYARAEHTKRRPVVGLNLGTNGATTRSLGRSLQDPTTWDHVAQARVVLVAIGANDLTPQLAAWNAGGCPRSCFAPAVDAMGQRLGADLAAIQQARSARTGPGAVLVLDYWNVFQDGRQTEQTKGHAVVAWSRRVTRLANRAICAQAAAYGAECVDTYRAFLRHGDPSALLAADGDHPDAAGVRVIVRRLLARTPRHTF